MSIPNYRIKDLASFREATEAPRTLAGLYFFEILDCLVELAYEVSADFRKRPQLYRDLGEIHHKKNEQAELRRGIALILAELSAKYGTEIDFLDRDQRNAIYIPIFGHWDGPIPASMPLSTSDDSFTQLRDDLLRAASAFAERAEDTGVEMLREGVVTAHRPFKDYLVWIQGDSAKLSKEVLFDLTEKTCYSILRNPAIAAVFGITKRISESDHYPYATDPAEDALIEEISIKLACPANSHGHITRCRISNLQRAALRGTEAIATVIDFEETKQAHEDLELLISKCYTWGTALTSLKAGAAAPSMAAAAGTSQSQMQATTPATGASSTKAPTGYGRVT